jgi:hypothetical protein
MRAGLALAASARDQPQAWNDVAHRTKEEVLQALATAISLVKEEPGEIESEDGSQHAATDMSRA